MITDKLCSCVKPIKTLAPEADHRAHEGLDNTIDGSHRPTRKREKIFGRFKSHRQTQRLLSAYDQTNLIFRPADFNAPQTHIAMPEMTRSASGQNTPSRWWRNLQTSNTLRHAANNLAQPKQQTGMIMSLYTKSFTIWLLATHSALAHEFWIEPRAYTLPSQATIEADLLVGSEFVGQDYIFIPKGYSSALFSRGDVETELAFTGQDNPSLSLQSGENGLHTIVLVSNASTLKHDTLADFREFAETVGRGAEVFSTRPGQPIREAYFRYAKTLVGVGDKRGQDRAYGAIYEWVALDNPYVTLDGPVRFQLLLNGEANANQPVQVFARPVGSEAETGPQHMMTDANGILTLSDDIRGEIMINSVKLLPVKHNDFDWVSYWASLTFER